MNRINVILICITALAIFYILNKKSDVDISKYEDQINLLQQKITGLEQVNDSLQVVEKELEDKLSSYDVTIKNLKGQINVIKKETQAKLDSVDKFGDNELEWFFANRYRFNKDSIN